MAGKLRFWMCLTALLLSACGGSRETYSPTTPAAATLAPAQTMSRRITPQPEKQKTRKPEVTKKTPLASLIPLPPSPYSPQTGDEQLQRNPAYIRKASVQEVPGSPPAYTLILAGDLPTPCHQLRVSAQPPDEQFQIQIEAYSLADPEMICVQVLEPFEVEVALGSFSSGRYSVWLNGKQVGEILAP